MSQSKKITIGVFIDAFGWDILKNHSFLDDILITKKPVESVLGYSATCVPTILTGKVPQEHGHLSFYFYSPKTSPFKCLRPLGLLPKSIVNRGRVRNLISKILKKLYGYTGYFQIYNMPFKYIHLFDYSEKNDIYERGGINNGTPTIFDFMRDRSIPFHKSDWRKDETVNFNALISELKKKEIRFAYLYWAQMDSILHDETKDGSHIPAKIKWYEDRLRKAYETARENYETVELFIFSDHGMCTITEDCDLMKQIETAGLEFGKDYVAVYDSTMARFWFLSDKARPAIEAVLKKETRGRILIDEDLKRYHCHFADRKYGDLFFLMHPGKLICPSHMGEKTIGGMHGYDPTSTDALAIFASNIKPENLPQKLTDHFKIMADSVLSGLETEKASA
ncbi:MAG: alkaline phosphatase family protein [Candidatus Omnitrophica bacterium]|nr:alkaline phosphatase family protein [Candidatus Omnitrophota bacterium]